ncbi:MAG: hypothetical protein ABFS56_20930 [Pseudomonadota bacterium]
MKSETGFNLSLQWFELHSRRLWLGIVIAIYFIQFFSVLLERIELSEWIISCTLVFSVWLNNWRIEKIINFFDNYKVFNNKRAGRYFFSAKSRIFVLGLLIGSASILLLPVIIIVYIAFLDLIFIAFSLMNARVGILNILPAGLMSITARFLRLRKEGVVIRCKHKDCSNRFENPKLQCNQCHQGHVWTWPTLLSPLFAVCSYSKCQYIYPTWQPAAEAVKSGKLSFKYDPCQFASNCQNLGLEESEKYYRVLLICFDGANAAQVIKEIDIWFGTTPRLKSHQQRIRLPQGICTIPRTSIQKNVNLQITLLNHQTSPPIWAGGYDWLIIIPKNIQQIETEARFALSRVELPVTSMENQSIPSYWKRLLAKPRKEELTAGRGIPPKLGIWSKLKSSNEFESFIRGIKP